MNDALLRVWSDVVHEIEITKPPFYHLENLNKLKKIFHNIVFFGTFQFQKHEHKDWDFLWVQLVSFLKYFSPEKDKQPVCLLRTLDENFNAF